MISIDKLIESTRKALELPEPQGQDKQKNPMPANTAQDEATLALAKAKLSGR